MSMFQNFAAAGLNDKQRALLLAMVAGGSPNPRMQAPLSAASQGLMQSIQEEANRKQREQEAASVAAARAQELGVREREAQATREQTAQYQKDVLEDRALARQEMGLDREEARAARRTYDSERLEVQRIQAAAAQEASAALAAQRREQATLLQKRLEMINNLMAQGRYNEAAALMANKTMDPMATLLGGEMSPYGTTAPQAPTTDELLELMRRPGTPPRG